MPKFSVITITYNSDKTVEDTIVSVGKQKNVDIEHILIDGGSTDHTMDIVNRYRDQFSAIISEPDNGIYDAMNKGIKLSTNEFIGFLNSDDYFASPNSLAVLGSVLAESDTDAVWGDVLQVDMEGIPRRLISGGWFKPSRLSFGLMPPHPSFYMKTSVIKAVGGFDPSYRIAGDFDLMRRLFKQQEFTSRYVSELITVMRVGGISTNGIAATHKVSTEILKSLSADGEPVKPFRLNFRYPLRAMEVAHGRLLSFSGRRFKPMVDV